jgi:hypothetical protein
MQETVNGTGDASRMRVRQRAHIVAARRGESTVLLDVTRGAYYSLDGVGARVWDLLGDPTSAEAVIADLVREYDAPPERIADDVAVLLRQLAAAHLVVIERS